MHMRLLALLLLLVTPAAAATASADFFETRIRPLLAEKCHSCHTDAQMSGLRLDSRAAVLPGRISRPCTRAG